MSDLQALPADSIDPTQSNSNQSFSGLPSVPNFLVGSDSHNYGNGNFSVLDPTSYGDGLANIGKFIVGSAVSGGASMYNSGVTVANWLGSDSQQVDTQQVLSGIDDDLGQYYSQHRTAEDLVGFLATSFVPGISGIKVLNAGQKMLAAVKEGSIGYNMARTIGLLPSASEMFAAQSASEIASAGAQMSSITSSTLKALSSGLVQNVLEGAAFETAVQASMFQSPILSQQSGSDIAKNILVGGALQGVIGGAFNAAKVFSTIKRVVGTADEAFMPSKFINELTPQATPADRLIQRVQDIADAPSFSSMEDFTTNYLAKFPNLGDTDPIALYNRFTANLAQRSNNLNNAMVSDLGAIVGKDPESIQAVSNMLTKLPSGQAQQSLDSLIEAGRISTPLKGEADILQQLGNKGPVNPNGPIQTVNKAVQYVELYGDNAGRVSPARPLSPTLADQLPNAAAVNSRVASYGFQVSKAVATSSTDANAAEARFIWARSQTVLPGSEVSASDIPLLEQAYLQKVPTIGVRNADGSLESISNSSDLLNRIKQSKEETALALLADGKKVPEIARQTNLSEDYLNHTASTDPTRNLFARQTMESDYTKDLVQRGLRQASDGPFNLDTTPRFLKTVYDLRKVQDVDGNVVQGMSRIKAQQALNQATVDNVVAKQMGALDSTGALANRFWHPGDDALLKANRFGAGPGLFKFANGSYGSLASWAESIGGATAQFMRGAKQALHTEMDPVLAKLYSKPQAAVEFSSINEEIASTAEKYVMNDTGDGLTLRSMQRYRQDIAAGKTDVEPPQIQEGARLDIPIQNPEALEAIQSHIQINGKRNTRWKELRASQGLEDSKDASTFYPIKPDPSQFKHFAFIEDPTVTGAGHMKMIHATSATDLQKLIDRVPEPFTVRTKQDTADFFKAKNEYEWDRGLHENYIDSTIQSRGINSQFFPQTDPQAIVNKIANFHTRGEEAISRELVSAKFGTEFSELDRLGASYDSANNSRYASRNQDLEAIDRNPYTSYKKTALNISRVGEIPLLNGANKLFDATISRAWNTTKQAFANVNKPEDLDAINANMQKYGIKTAYYDAALNLLANKTPDAGALRSFVGRGNGILGSLVIGLDPLSHINNAIGHQVLLGAETQSLMRNIMNGNRSAAGALADISRIALPGVQGDSITAASKLVANSIGNYFKGDVAAGLSRSDLIARYRGMGIIKNVTEQFHSILDDLSITGAESANTLNAKLQTAIGKAKSINEFGQKWSGGNLSEEFQGFIAADVMRQITDIGIKGGVIGQDAAQSYINTFVNRVRGNITATQRPIMFQGPIGQALGLFQTYQMNMMQQMLRHIGEGSAKDVATLLGLQGTIYGMQSLPGFNFINQHIVGNASGNIKHRDLYDATYGTLGKGMGDWLMYGAPSKMLQVNLYTRGDMNPRSLTIIPTNPADIPIFGAYGKFFGNLKDTATKMAQGSGVWNSFLSGIEHNGISRPLAGLAQVIQGGATNAKGNLIGTNDLLSYGSLARLAGARPLDEAITNDAVYRTTAYQAEDHLKQQALGASIKAASMSGQAPTEEQVAGFAKAYTYAGGTPTNFSKFMVNEIMSAKIPVANKLILHLKAGQTQTIQEIMGGRSNNATPSMTQQDTSANISAQ